MYSVSHARGGWKLKQRVRAGGAHPTHAGYAGYSNACAKTRATPTCCKWCTSPSTAWRKACAIPVKVGWVKKGRLKTAWQDFRRPCRVCGLVRIVSGSVYSVSHARGGWKLKQRVRAGGAHPTHAGYAGYSNACAKTRATPTCCKWCTSPSTAWRKACAIPVKVGWVKKGRLKTAWQDFRRPCRVCGLVRIVSGSNCVADSSVSNIKHG